jgi:choline monooxygenase
MLETASLLTAAEIRDVRAPIAAARTLPPRAYRDPAFFEAERAAIFHGGWAAAALAQLIPSPGDGYPIDFVGAPLLLVRGHDRVVRVFHNLNPYDQCPVLLEPVRSATRLVGAYHGFEFDLAGNLLRAPYWNGTDTADAGGLPAELHSLAEVECREFLGVVFVNLAHARLSSFEDFIAPLHQRYGALDFAALDIDRCADGEPRIEHGTWAGNWKTHHENACANIYHENFVHGIYATSSHVPRVDAVGGKAYEEIVDSGLRGLAFDQAQAGDTYIDMGVPPLRTQAGEPVVHNTIVSLYPNLYASLIAQHLHLTIITPAGPEQVYWMSASYFAASVAQSEALLPMRESVSEGWAQAGAEDARIVAAIQRARHSPRAAPGFYAPFWDRPHWDLNQQIVRDLLADNPENI